MNLYFECNSGAAGDMLASALLDLFDNKESVAEELNGLGLPDTVIEYKTSQQNGICGVHLGIIINGETETPDTLHGHHSHRKLSDILEIIDTLKLDEKTKTDVRNIYSVIADAEAKAHGTEVGEVHFHELGMLDAVADITVCAYLISKLNPDRIICSPINTGSGTVKCAHGILPVPVPAVVNILKGVPYYKSEINTELCTPTGAAILKYYADEFSNTVDFGKTVKTGIGCGTKKLETANILRVFEFEESTVSELACSIDDMTGEEAAFAAEKMMAEGALDCFFAPVFMKKGRPAYLFTVLCKSTQTEKFAKLIFKHTTTIGIRKYTPSRYTLDRTLSEENGVHIKRSEGYDTMRNKIEFEDIKKLAEDKDISLFEAREILENKMR